MFRKMFLRLLTALAFILPLSFAIAAASQADPGTLQQGPGECQDCHQMIQNHWGESGHGQATDNQAFQQAWQTAAEDPNCLVCHTTGFDPASGTWEADGVSCSTCHSPAPSNHPDQIMPTDVSSRLCGTCHLDTYSDWTDSAHSQEELACVRCHSPHTTSLKTDDAEALCSGCHSEEVHFYSYTSHYEAGLTCTDCHLRVSETTLGEGHGQRSHTFQVDMDTCSQCHEDDMHFPMPDTSTGASGGSAAAAGSADAVAAGLPAEPKPVSPAGFAVLAALLGTALGLILAPWSERWYRRFR